MVRTREQIEEAISWRWSESRRQLFQEHSVLDRNDPRTLLAESHQTAARVLTSALPAHVAVLDFAIQWFAEFHFAISFARELSENAEKSETLQVADALTGAVCNYAVGVRTLVNSGLEGSARALSRALCEHSYTCVALADEPELARGFVEAGAFEEGYRFWSSKVRRKELERLLVHVERSVAPAMDDEILAVLAKMRKDSMLFMSGSVHPTYATATIISSMPPQLDRPGWHGSGIFGLASSSLGGNPPGVDRCDLVLSDDRSRSNLKKPSVERSAT